MSTRRSSRGSGGILATTASSKHQKTSKQPEQSENEFTENEDSNRMSGAFELGVDDIKNESKKKHTGSLFAAKIFDEPRRRSIVGASDKLLPMKKTKPVPMKINKKKPVPVVSESEFDNMADMFGTSPFSKPAPPTKTNVKTADRKTPTKSVVAKKPASVVQKTPVKVAPVKEKHIPLASNLANKKPERPVEPALTEEQCNLAARFDDLQRRFEQLNMLRNTSAEQLLADYKKTAETRDHAAQKLIESLKHENSLLREKFEAQNKSRRDSNVSVMSTTSVGISTEAQGILNLYRDLSGMTMETLGEARWACTIEGRHGSYSFELEFDAEEAEYTYTPVFTKEATVWERLPSYLKEEIVFGEGYLQSFFWRALNFLMSQ